MLKNYTSTVDLKNSCPKILLDDINQLIVIKPFTVMTYDKFNDIKRHIASGISVARLVEYSSMAHVTEGLVLKP